MKTAIERIALAAGFAYIMAAAINNNGAMILAAGAAGAIYVGLCVMIMRKP
jgi:hypothetical protein